MPRKLLRHLFFALYIAAASAILLFAALEFTLINRLVGLDLPYYVMRRTYAPHSELVFTPRLAGRAQRARFSYRGDLYWDGFGVDVQPIDVDVTYGPSGFRSNRSAAPYDIAVIGDSYIELSETDDNTFTAYLVEHSGRSVLNLGMAWYGPYQYVEVLKRLPDQQRPPRHVLFMFYAGNDIEDIRQYEQWREGGSYYGQDRRYWEASAPRRFTIAAGQALERARRRLPRRPRSATPAAEQEAGVHPRLAIVRLADRAVPMSMAVRTPELSANSLLARDDWRTLHSLVGEFGQLARERGSTPVLVYLPTKMQTYADHIDPASGRDILEGADAQRRFAASEADALAAIAEDTNLCFIDILPVFQTLAANGELLYHPFDTHWNERGREAAARTVAAALGHGRSADQPNGLRLTRHATGAAGPRCD